VLFILHFPLLAVNDLENNATFILQKKFVYFKQSFCVTRHNQNKFCFCNHYLTTLDVIPPMEVFALSQKVLSTKIDEKPE